jgi:hypothetical protein
MEITKIPTTDDWIKKMWYLYAMEFYFFIFLFFVLFNHTFSSAW